MKRTTARPVVEQQVGGRRPGIFSSRPYGSAALTEPTAKTPNQKTKKARFSLIPTGNSPPRVRMPGELEIRLVEGAIHRTHSKEALNYKLRTSQSRICCLTTWQ